MKLLNPETSLVKRRSWTNLNVDLYLLAQKIDEFFTKEGFKDVQIEKDPNGTWFEVHVFKKGFMHIPKTKQAITIQIQGNSTNFTILEVLGNKENKSGIIGIGLSLKLSNKFWSFLEAAIVTMTNETLETVNGASAIASVSLDEKTNSDENSKQKEDSPLFILKMRLVKGEISRKEYEELKELIE